MNHPSSLTSPYIQLEAQSSHSPHIHCKVKEQQDTTYNFRLIQIHLFYDCNFEAGAMRRKTAKYLF